MAATTSCNPGGWTQSSGVLQTSGAILDLPKVLKIKDIFDDYDVL